ncbi:MAG: alanine:cation symporter family protein, partial [Clostridia bacterium]|nr:alanine:cation symporter family protein [Clostridia bacterium]
MSVLKNIVWGLPTVVLLTVFGVFFTHKSRFYSIKAIRSILRDLYLSLFREKRDGVSPLAAVATALGGTVGIGSIVGVGYALAAGGAGSIFWMWVCSFFGMGLKYAEVKIALNRRRVGVALGGAPFRLKEMGFDRLAVAFCIICILASFGTGNLTQINALSGLLVGKGIAKPLCALICVVTIGFAVFGGRMRISRINLFLVPSASFIYLSACVFVIIVNRRLIWEVIALVFREAIGFSAMAHGVSGAMISNALRVGFARSIFSNEAGMGSSPLAHATSSEQNPEIQAKWGIFEIFFDSFLVSTLTAFALLLSKTDSPELMFSFHFGQIG